LVCVALGLSVALNFRSLDSTAQKNRAEELWFEAFKSDNTELRNEAARAIGEIAKTSPAAADKLVAALSDQKPGVRLSALEGLENSGPAARAATTALMRLQNTDDNDRVRRKAVELLKTIQGSPEGVSASIGTFLSWCIAIVVGVGIAAVAFFTLRKPGRAARTSR
jgi:hypothetical protein